MDERERFEAFFRSEHPGLVWELRLLLHDPRLAEDVAADAFVVAWNRWAEVADLDRPGAWVRRVALRQAGRARWRRTRRPLVEATFDAARPPTPEEVDPDLVAALRQLTEPQRQAVVLHHLGGWPAHDVAVVLGCAEPTVRSHLRRGRLRLAELLGDRPDLQEVSDADHR